MSMAKNVNTKIILRNDTFENWSKKNPVLDTGEIAVITDQNTFKIGDGTSKFDALPQIRAIASDVEAWAKKKNVVDVVISGYTKSDASGALTATDTIAVALSKIENSISAISNAATKVVASNKNGYITVDGKDVKVYELKTDGTTIVTAEDGTIGVGAVTMDKVTGLNDKLTAIENGIPTYSIEKDADSGDYAAVYHLKKNDEIVGVPINIPKDMVVESGSVVTDADATHKGVYIKLVLANATNDVIWIPASGLVEYVTSGSSVGDMVVVAVSADHKVTATITDGTITKAKLDTNIQTALDKAHSHSNIEELNKIVAGDKAKWDLAAGKATKVEGSETNGNIKVDGVETTVYTLPDTVINTSDVLILNCGNADGVA